MRMRGRKYYIRIVWRSASKWKLLEGGRRFGRLILGAIFSCFNTAVIHGLVCWVPYGHYYLIQVAVQDSLMYRLVNERANYFCIPVIVIRWGISYVIQYEVGIPLINIRRWSMLPDLKSSSWIKYLLSPNVWNFTFHKKRGASPYRTSYYYMA